MVEETYFPHWTGLAEADIVIRELISVDVTPRKDAAKDANVLKWNCRCNGDYETD